MTETLTRSQDPQSPCVLIVGGGSDLHQRLRRAVAGLRTVVLARASVVQWVYGLAENEAVVLLNDDAGADRWVSAALYLHREWQFTAIASFAEIDQDRAALIAARLGLAFHSEETVLAVQDKHVMRGRLAHHRVDEIPFRQVRSPGELYEFYDEIGPPIILKPTAGRASAGISVILSRNDIPIAFTHTAGATAPRMVSSLPLAERLVDGPEFSIECISHRGQHYVIAVTEKFKDELTKVEVGHVVPARISQGDEAALIAHVRRALTALDVKNGVSHTEVILGVDGPVFIETHLRLGGDQIPELVEIATGVSLAELHVLQVAGQDIGALPELVARERGTVYVGAAAIRYLAPDAYGRLAAVGGLDAAQNVSDVVEVRQLIADGSELKGLSSSYARLCSAMTNSIDSDAAVARAEEAIGFLTARIEPPQ